MNYKKHFHIKYIKMFELEIHSPLSDYNDFMDNLIKNLDIIIM